MAGKRTRWPGRDFAHLENAGDVWRTYIGNNDSVEIPLAGKRSHWPGNDFAYSETPPMLGVGNYAAKNGSQFRMGGGNGSDDRGAISPIWKTPSIRRALISGIMTRSKFPLVGKRNAFPCQV